jgi:prefoldin subunit 5
LEALKKRIEKLEYLMEELIYKLGKNNQRISYLMNQMAYLEKELARGSNVYERKLLNH